MSRTQAIPEIETIKEQEFAQEPLYRVIIHNDDITPMDFVVHVLVQIFLLHQTDAVRIMLTAHYRGDAYVQTLPKGEAQTRIGKAHFAAGLDGYPLHFSMEQE